MEAQNRIAIGFQILEEDSKTASRGQTGNLFETSEEAIIFMNRKSM